MSLTRGVSIAFSARIAGAGVVLVRCVSCSVRRIGVVSLEVRRTGARGVVPGSATWRVRAPEKLKRSYQSRRRSASTASALRLDGTHTGDVAGDETGLETTPSSLHAFLLGDTGGVCTGDDVGCSNVSNTSTGLECADLGEAHGAGGAAALAGF